MPSFLQILCNCGLRLIGELINEAAPRNSAILENTLGILRNISSNIAQVPEYRAEVRESGILTRLVALLRSSNDTIISTAAGALWNLSARSQTDQLLLRECGAVSVLRSLSSHTDKTVSTHLRKKLDIHSKIVSAVIISYIYSTNFTNPSSLCRSVNQRAAHFATSPVPPASAPTLLRSAHSHLHSSGLMITPLSVLRTPAPDTAPRYNNFFQVFAQLL